ncbi:MAG: pyrroline-5-carboxylate reductase [Candidatus Omnitrophota bacterium]
MFKILRKKIGIIGFGNMGSTIANRISRKYCVFIFDKDKNKTQNLQGIQLANNVLDLVSKVDVIILAVKPQDFNVVLNEIKDHLENKLVISIAAGIATVNIEKVLGNIKVIRAMPNLPAKIGKGMICFSRGKFTDQKDLNFSLRLFKNLGKTMSIDEKLMNDVTAAAGSGPAFFYEFIEKKGIHSKKIPKEVKKEFDKTIADYLVSSNVGWTKSSAMLVVSTTSAGSLALLNKVEGHDPQKLIIQIASKGGTTEAGLERLRNGTLKEAMDAAIKKAEELSKS